MQIDKLLSFLYSSLSQSCPFPTPILSLLHETFPVAGELGPAQFTSGNAAPEKADPYESQLQLCSSSAMESPLIFL